MSTTTTMRQNIHLAVRRLPWDFSAAPASPVCDDAGLAAFLIAISFFVVALEDVGIPVVRSAVARLGDHPALAREARVFVSQEALHSQAHALYNAETKRRHGIDTVAIERECARFIAEMSQPGEQWQLAAIAGLEHVIFSVADWYENARTLHPRVAPDFHRLLLWHAMEETEHTAVVHDMYTHIYGSGASAYRTRVAAMTGSMRLATRTVLRIWRELLPQMAARMNLSPDPRRSWAAFTRASAPYLGEILGFYAPRHRPWERDMPADLLPGLRSELAPLAANGLTTMVVTSVTDIAREVRSYTLVPPEGGLVAEWTAGAHVDVEIEPGLVRQYSLCGDPADRTHYRIAVKRELLGRGGSLRLHQEVSRGSTLRIGRPRNHFIAVADTAEHANETLLLAAGIGMTPLLAMAHVLHERGAAFRLHLCARDHASLPFATTMAEWPFAPQVSTHLSRADGNGRAELSSLIPAWNAASPRLLYICGPAAFMEAAGAAAAAAGWPATAVHVERFGGKVGGTQPQRAFQLHLQRSQKTLAVGAHQTILEAMEAHGLQPRNSCREGICGACVCKAVDGAVEHRDAILSHIEQGSGQLAICVSRAGGDSLTLDL